MDNFDVLNQICPKRVFPIEDKKISLLLASEDVTYYAKLFRNDGRQTQVQNKPGRQNSLSITVTSFFLICF